MANDRHRAVKRAFYRDLKATTPPMLWSCLKDIRAMAYAVRRIVKTLRGIRHHIAVETKGDLRIGK